MNIKDCILTVNAGSSGIKFSLFSIEKDLTELYSGRIEKTATGDLKIIFRDAVKGTEEISRCKVNEVTGTAGCLIEYLEKKTDVNLIKAAGHRIVNGLTHKEPELITADLISALKKITAYDPEHLPEALDLINVLGERFPAIQQIACFDTSFHSSMPTIAKMLTIPRRYYDAGIQRYGFHGISYAYLMEELEKSAGATVARGSVILAHLGNGASLAAVKGGKSIDTSMGFTPASGIMMGTRSGDLDPGVAWYLMDREQMTTQDFNHLINHESGLLGISETTSDMRDLLTMENTDSRAAEAIALFCYRAKKWIGSLAAALGGADTLVFSGGIGEHSPEIRSRICEGLSFLGIEINEAANKNNERIISADSGKVSVYVINTNEELMIARSVIRLTENK